MTTEEATFRNPALTVDGVVVHDGPGGPAVLLIRRGLPPFAGSYALPGGFVEYGEDIADAILREIAEETGLRGVAFTQFRAFGSPGRDPRGHTVSIVYTAVLRGDLPPVAGGDDAAEARWFPVGNLPDLAFDHGEILHQALTALSFLKESES
ncbi:MAG: NUDIX hydrolase [bacterium]